MTEPRDPLRWRDAASDADPLLREALGTARRGPDAAELDALVRRVEQGVRTRVIASVQPRRVGFRVLSALGLGLAGLVALWLAMRAASAPVASAPSAEPVRPAPVASAPSAEPAAPPRAVERGASAAAPGAAQSARVGSRSDQPAAPAPVPAEEAAPGAPRVDAPVRAASHAPEPSAEAASEPNASRPTRASRSLVARPSARVAGDAGGARVSSPVSPANGHSGVPAHAAVPPELQLLSAAQRALRNAPAHALELAERHAESYPGGRFAQEREEITIEALFALGREPAARARARVFLERYPGSMQAARLRKRLREAGH